jgi:hypothetical protein
MSNSKISALPAATTPLAGTEVLPIVQSSATKQVSVANLTAGRAISATSVTASTGNFIVGTSGQGIDFSATPGTGTSELLNDYEEGTWTPVIVGATTAGTGTYTTQVGTYTKIGRVVYVRLQLAWSAHTGVGNMSVLGLPFTSSSNPPSQMAIGTYDLTYIPSYIILARQEINSTQISLLQLPAGGGAWQGCPMDAAVVSLEITGFYFV